MRIDSFVLDEEVDIRYMRDHIFKREKMRDVMTHFGDVFMLQTDRTVDNLSVVFCEHRYDT